MSKPRIFLGSSAEQAKLLRAIANAAYKRQRRNPGVTEIVKLPNRGHSLTIDHGWREVAQTAPRLRRAFASPGYRPRCSVGTRAS